MLNLGFSVCPLITDFKSCAFEDLLHQAAKQTRGLTNPKQVTRRSQRNPEKNCYVCQKGCLKSVAAVTLSRKSENRLGEVNIMP